MQNSELHDHCSARFMVIYILIGLYCFLFCFGVCVQYVCVCVCVCVCDTCVNLSYAAGEADSQLAYTSATGWVRFLISIANLISQVQNHAGEKNVLNCKSVSLDG